MDKIRECKNGTATSKDRKEQAKVLGQQCVINFVHKNWNVFCSKKKKREIITKMNTVHIDYFNMALGQQEGMERGGRQE